MTLFVLRPPVAGSGGVDFSHAPPSRLGDAPKCDRCGRYIGMLPSLPPYQVVLDIWGSPATFTDFAFGPGGDLLVSERFKRLWDDHGLVGLQGFTLVEVVEIKRRKRSRPRLEAPPDYYLVTVVRSNAAIDAHASELEIRDDSVCPLCRLGTGTGIILRTKRIVLEPNTWDGEDIFIARGLPGTRLVSAKLRQLILEHEISGLRLIPADQYGFDFYPGSPSHT